MEKTKTNFLDYSLLVDALYDGDESRVNTLIKEMMPKLIDYLKITMGASHTDAEECTQHAFLKVLVRIKKGKIKNKKAIYTYLLKTCRHEYLRYIKKNRRFTEIDDDYMEMSEPAEQVERLLDEERQKILKECLDELDEESREFIVHFLNNPDTTTKEASKIFNISGANVRTRKFRITRTLHEAYKRKSEVHSLKESQINSIAM